ncbi:MAG: dipeptidase [Pseudomonadales bacterium]
MIQLKVAVAIAAIVALASCGQSGDTANLDATPRADIDPRQDLGAATDVQARAEQLAQRLLIVDTHIDVPYRLHLKFQDVGEATPDGDFDYPRAVAGGLDALFMSIYIPARVDEAGDARAFAHGMIDDVEALTRAHPDKFTIATCAADIDRAKADGLIAMPLGMENGGPLEGSFEVLDEFRDRGVRYITLTHSRSNHISDSSYDTDEGWGGLSPFGRELIPVMNQRGVMVDVSHISDAAFWQVIELSQTPVIASHSSLRHFTPGWQRNMADDMVEALGRNGGVIQISFGSIFLTAEAGRWSEARTQALEQLRAQPDVTEDDPRLASFNDDYRAQHPYPFADLDDVLDHIDRAVMVAGIDHVGLGSDYDGVGDSLPVGLKDVSTYPNLVAGLLRRGYDEAAIEKILGGNIMRVWREVEQFATAAGYPPACRIM